MADLKKKHFVSSDDNEVLGMGIVINNDEGSNYEVKPVPMEESYDDFKKKVEGRVKLNLKITIPEEKKEMLKKDLLSKEDILSVKIVTPHSNPTSVGIDDSLYSIESFAVSEEVERVGSRLLKRPSLTNVRYFAVKSYPIDSIAKEKEDGEDYLRINGDIRIKRKGSSEPKELDRIFFTDRETAYSVASIATEVELEKVTAMEKELNSVKRFLTDQFENGRF